MAKKVVGVVRAWRGFVLVVSVALCLLPAVAESQIYPCTDDPAEVAYYCGEAALCGRNLRFCYDSSGGGNCAWRNSRDIFARGTDPCPDDHSGDGGGDGNPCTRDYCASINGGEGFCHHDPITGCTGCLSNADCPEEQKLCFWADRTILYGICRKLRVCEGDCNGNMRVSVDELVSAVNMALTHRGDCDRVDMDKNGAVDIHELVMAVKRLLRGCPS